MRITLTTDQRLCKHRIKSRDLESEWPGFKTRDIFRLLGDLAQSAKPLCVNLSFFMETTMDVKKE